MSGKRDSACTGVRRPKQPGYAGGAPLWLKMVAARVGLSEPPIGDRVEADAFWVAFDPDKQSGPRCIKVLFFVAPGNGEHVWQCLELTCGVTVAF